MAQQCLDIVVLPRELSFRKQGVYLPMTDTVKEFGTRAALGFRDQVVRVTLRVGNRAFADRANGRPGEERRVQFGSEQFAADAAGHGKENLESPLDRRPLSEVLQVTINSRA